MYKRRADRDPVTVSTLRFDNFLAVGNLDLYIMNALIDLSSGAVPAKDIDLGYDLPP